MATKKKTPKGKTKTPSLDELVDLSPAQVRALPKPRPGYEAHVGPLLDLYEGNQDSLGAMSQDLGEVRARYGAFSALASVEASATKHLEMVQETRLLHSSRVWSALLDIYGRGQQAAKRNPAIAAKIADFEKFMRQGPRKAKAPNPPG